MYDCSGNHMARVLSLVLVGWLVGFSTMSWGQNIYGACKINCVTGYHQGFIS